jgi:hypothetical protein
VSIKRTEVEGLQSRLERAEAAMRDQMRAAMGSPTEQYERLEALIDALFVRNPIGIDRGSCPWWKAPAPR